MKKRLFIDNLDSEISFFKNSNQFHYLINVLKSNINDDIFLFNENEEYRYKISEISKKSLKLQKLEQIKSDEKISNLILLCALVKPDKMTLIIKQAVEIGIKEIFPILTERSQSEKLFNKQKLLLNAIEALEQSGGLKLPILHNPITLNKMLNQLNDYYLLYGSTKSLSNNDIYRLPNTKSKKIAVLIGPEGGFSENEEKLISQIPNSYALNLGNRIMRTETASAVILGLAKTLLDY